mmetsp:Transcript_5212/g.22261  ORF Transcript_5212/g.22261 Transcript_5212/m.22261 type:complete len:123 (-) Transcript_5212:106-474(-)
MSPAFLNDRITQTQLCWEEKGVEQKRDCSCPAVYQRGREAQESIRTTSSAQSVEAARTVTAGKKKPLPHKRFISPILMMIPIVQKEEKLPTNHFEPFRHMMDPDEVFFPLFFTRFYGLFFVA